MNETRRKRHSLGQRGVRDERRPPGLRPDGNIPVKVASPRIVFYVINATAHAYAHVAACAIANV